MAEAQETTKKGPLEIQERTDKVIPICTCIHTDNDIHVHVPTLQACQKVCRLSVWGRCAYHVINFRSLLMLRFSCLPFSGVVVYAESIPASLT